MLPHLSDSICFQRKQSVIYPVPVFRASFSTWLGRALPCANSSGWGQSTQCYHSHATGTQGIIPRALPGHGTHSRKSTTLEWPKAWIRRCYNIDHMQRKLLIQYFSMYGKEESQNTVHTGLVKQQIEPPSGFPNRQSQVRQGSAGASHSLSHQCGLYRQQMLSGFASWSDTARCQKRCVNRKNPCA